jgi:plastocyanin
MRVGTVLAGLVLVGVAVACGSGGSGYTTAIKSGAGSPTGGTPTPSVGTTSATIADYAFSPQTVTVKVGGTVQWMNGGSAAHTVTSDNGTFDSGQLSGAGGGAYGMGGGTGGTYSATFGTVGTFTYHCANHTSMTGTITVTP